MASMPNASIAETEEISRIARQHHGDGRQNSCMHYKEHRPSPEKSQGWRINLLQKDIHAAGVGKKTRQFRAHQRGAKREYA